MLGVRGCIRRFSRDLWRIAVTESFDKLKAQKDAIVQRDRARIINEWIDGRLPMVLNALQEVAEETSGLGEGLLLSNRLRGLAEELDAVLIGPISQSEAGEATPTPPCSIRQDRDTWIYRDEEGTEFRIRRTGELGCPLVITKERMMSYQERAEWLGLAASVESTPAHGPKE